MKADAVGRPGDVVVGVAEARRHNPHEHPWSFGWSGSTSWRMR